MAMPLMAQREGFTRARDHPPPSRRGHGPVLAQPMPGTSAVERGNPLSVAEDPSIGYGRPAAGASEPEPLRVTSAEICPVVALQAEDEHGNVFELAGPLETFLPLARQLLAINDAMAQAPQYHEEPYDDTQRAAG